MYRNNKLASSVRWALLAGATAAAVTAVPSYAAEGDEGVERIEVTGSRIARTDMEGPSPVTVFGKEELAQSGESSVADFLRQTTYNTAGSFRERSGVGNGATGNAQVSLRGLGANRTLVLVDGRRMSGSPSFGGSAQNLNLIPMGAVERIEVLRDGASAIYGSDAIAGVINVILRKDYQGLELSINAERPTEDGGDRDKFTMVGGMSSDKGNVTFSWEHYEKEIIFNNQRDFSAVGLSSYGFPGSYRANGYARDASGNLLQERDPETGALLFDDNGNPVYGTVGIRTFADPRCPDALGGSSEFPDSQKAVVSNFGDEMCYYNHAATSAAEAGLKRDSVFVNANYEVTDDINVFSRTLVTRVESFGRYAPAPRSGGSPSLATMDGSNANNPTAGGVSAAPWQWVQDPDTGRWSKEQVEGADFVDYGSGLPLSIYYRNVPGGTRDSSTEDVGLTQTVGFNGYADILGGATWEVGTTFNKSTNKDLASGYGFYSSLQDAIDNGSFDIFGVNGPTDADVAKSFGHMTVFDAKYTSRQVDGNISFDLFELPAGVVGAAFGTEWEKVEFSQVNDPQSNSGNVFGTSGGDNVTGGRYRRSAFAEFAIPLLETLEGKLAVRYDDYSDFGSTVNPQVALAWRPTDSLLVRASYGEGFRAPDMTELYGSLSQSFDDAIDTSACNAAGGPAGDADGDGVDDNIPCRNVQFQTLSGGNTDLEAEESKSWTTGVVFEPIENLSFGIDYYNIEFTNQISSLSAQDQLDREADGLANTVVRDAGGQVSEIRTNLQNLSGVKTRGLDFDVSYLLASDFGDFRFKVQATKILKYEQEDAPGEGYEDQAGVFFSDGASPDFRVNGSLNWAYNDYAASITANYIDKVDWNDSSQNIKSLASWTTVDAQFSYQTPWNGEVVLGVTNIANKMPPLSSSLGHPYYDNTVYDAYGRVPYIRYTQRF